MVFQKHLLPDFERISAKLCLKRGEDVIAVSCKLQDLGQVHDRRNSEEKLQISCSSTHPEEQWW